jgi:hypothetical protein
VKQDNVVKPTNPLTGKARSVISVHEKHQLFPDGNADKVRYFDNERIIRKNAELWLPYISSIDLPVIVRTDTARDVLLNAFVTGNRVVTGAPNVDVFSRSISCKSVSKNLRLDVSRLFPSWKGGCDDSGHRICSFDKSKIRFDGSHDYSIKMIPSCIEQLVNLEELYLGNTGVRKIENLEKNLNLNWLSLYGTGVKKIEGLENNVKLEDLALAGTDVSEIEGLENNVNLRWLGLSDTGVKKIEGLGNNVSLKELDLSDTGVKKIEGLGNNGKLEDLFLANTGVKKIEGLKNNVKLKWLDLTRTGIKKIEGLGKNVNLNLLNLYGTDVSESECDDFRKVRPGVLLYC